MTTMTLAPYMKQRWCDGQGNPLYLGIINTYLAGTLTPAPTYKDSVGTPNTNPIVLNARGEADIWMPPGVSMKFIVTDVLGNQIPGGTIDNVVGNPVGVVSSSNSAPVTWLGVSLNPSISYRVTGNIAVIDFPQSIATSTATTWSLTNLPPILVSTLNSQYVPIVGLMDNGAALTTASMVFISSAGTITFFKDQVQTPWTASGNKGFNQQASLVYGL